MFAACCVINLDAIVPSPPGENMDRSETDRAIDTARAVVEQMDRHNWADCYRVGLRALMGLRIAHEYNLDFMIAHRSFTHQLRLMGEHLRSNSDEQIGSARLACLRHLKEMRLAAHAK